MILTSFFQLAQDGLVNQSDARLLHELGERVRVLLSSYFRSPSGLFVSFTHLVCRSAIAGNTNIIHISLKGDPYYFPEKKKQMNLLMWN